MEVEEFKKVLPKGVRNTISDVTMSKINGVIEDPEVRDNFRENLISFNSVMTSGRFKIDSYVDAVKYVTYKLLGSSNQLAFMKAFPERYASFIEKGTSTKDIASYISSYNKNKLVNLVYAQTLVPTYVLNADIHQAAINRQFSIMNDPEASFKVQSDAANSLLTHLKAPDETKIELDIGIKADKTIEDLMGSVRELAQMQKAKIVEGVVTAKDIAHSELVINRDEEE